MSTIFLTCNCNFNEPSVVDKKVQKVFKMFEKHLKKKTSPINKQSDIESVYEYNNLSADNVRIFKKLAENNKSVIQLKEIVVDGDIKDKTNDSESDSDNEENSQKIPIVPVKQDSDSESDDEKNGNDSDSDSEDEKNGNDSDSDSEDEKNGNDSDSDSEDEKNVKTDNSDSDDENTIKSYSDSDSDSDSDNEPTNAILELSSKLDSMQTTIQNIERMLSKN